MIIRPALVEDSHGIALVHVSSWQHAYRGIVPQSILINFQLRTVRSSGSKSLNGAVQRRSSRRRPVTLSDSSLTAIRELSMPCKTSAKSTRYMSPPHTGQPESAGRSGRQR